MSSADTRKKSGRFKSESPATFIGIGTISLFGENVEKNISRVGTRRTAPESSQGIVSKGFLMCRRWGD